MSSSEEEIEVIVEQTVEEIDEGLKKSKHKLSNVKAEDIFKEKMIKLNQGSLEKFCKGLKLGAINLGYSHRKNRKYFVTLKDR